MNSDRLSLRLNEKDQKHLDTIMEIIDLDSSKSAKQAIEAYSLLLEQGININEITELIYCYKERQFYDIFEEKVKKMEKEMEKIKNYVGYNE